MVQKEIETFGFSSRVVFVLLFPMVLHFSHLLAVCRSKIVIRKLDKIETQ